MKLFISLLFLSVCALSAAQASLGLEQIFGAKSGFAGMQPAKFFRSIVLQSEAQKLLANPDLSDDLRLRVLDSVANAEQGFSDCSSPYMLP
ncbi:hypothetical protein EVAR_70186_1 [Eumeta japonica]|uniref:Uncharacterized protein n=1 Tax=Eumeta variegata TaxID=151549 RepID=A0A4C1SK36_EUMVA|nr:hypothetical protein EVAR_70186_1 [Eumeta japonica]